MTLQELLLFLTAIAFSSGGQLLLKLGAIKLGAVNSGNVGNTVLRILFTPELLLGLVLYAVSAILFILVLTRVKLSVAGPAVSVSYIFAVLFGYFVLKEPINVRQLFGLAFIVCGVLLVVKK
ncbi:MAG: EamA family transporter [Oscillatoriales cyanobacterium C42_A2020_001]|nr:EamA family transporter [Leptolyngbyaceae cyanobacterium C42_A2020_001]